VNLTLLYYTYSQYRSYSGHVGFHAKTVHLI